ncbi:MAG: chromosomal replication initiator protein DnaA [Candidatus Omnitrophica bacterium]|nr:chromosomal replication initiator protein DnaA [Candidatus Omnitrophota bacterium]
METIWKKALNNLRSEVNEQVFSAWFLPIRQISIKENVLTLSVPNKFFENWIKEKYISLISSTVQHVSGTSLNITFEIIENKEAGDPSKVFASAVSKISPPTASHKNKLSASVPASGNKDASGNWLKSILPGSRSLPESHYQTLGFNLNYTFENFVVGGSNRFAHAAALAVTEKLSKVYNPLFLYGGVGLGKTHLMQALGQAVLKKSPRSKVLYISSEEFMNQLINAIRTKTTPKFRAMYRNVDVLLIDDIQFIAGKESTQEEFFHTFNSLYDAHKQIVLCSDHSPREISGLEERLVSRFAWGLIADFQLPDFETRVAIMEKKSESEAVSVPKEILYFLAEHVKTNIREMEGALIRVVAYAELTGKKMTVALAKEVLGEMISAEEKKITIKLIQQVVSGFFNITEEDMKTKKRTRAIAYPRQIAMFLSRGLTDHSLPDIGRFFGGRDHTTVLHACDKIGKETTSIDKTKSVIDKLTVLIKK